MKLDHPRVRAFLAVPLLAVLAGVPAARAARTPATPGRLASATGPLVEGSRALPGGELTVAAASRGTVTDPDRAGAAIAAALDAASALASQLAAGADGGELTRLNASAAAERFTCSADLYAVLDAALAVAEATNGAYDPTAAPLARLWRQPREGDEPDPLALADTRQLVGWRLLLIEPGGRTVRFRRPGMELDLGAIAGGRVLQRAAAVLRERGIARARLELAGEVLTFTNHEAWTVEVPRPGPAPGPDAPDRGVAMRLRVSNAAVATADATAWPVAIDPRTGHGLSGEGSVTVVTAPKPGAPALAAALRVLGRDGAADYANRHADVGVLWLEPAGEGVHAWAWNLGAVTAEPGLRVEWQTEQ
jgi:FAD:protein FMN transferase